MNIMTRVSLSAFMIVYSRLLGDSIDTSAQTLKDSLDSVNSVDSEPLESNGEDVLCNASNQSLLG